MFFSFWVWPDGFSLKTIQDFWVSLELRVVIILTIWWILMFPVGQIMGTFLKGYYEPASYRESGLEKAGKLIGQLERTMVLIFYIGNSLEGIAFLVVAKSILRFSDLQQGHEERNSPRKNDDLDNQGFAISEYIILGSFLSYTVAIVAGITIDFILKL